MTIVPPGGFAGYSQMTNASKNQLAKGVRRGGGPGKRRKARKSKRSGLRQYKPKSKKVRLAPKRGGGTRRLKKGSAAAKAWGRKMRAARKRG